ncbi:hypothetical protein Tco_1057029 [Tanacetum coccineum]|uniref:Uncharacterized protein n=1 Tax=Tanacetum coccineum TaxID=301880 RepID=A0ABQ5H634_9ASTR
MLVSFMRRAHMVNCNPLELSYTTKTEKDTKLGPDGVPVQDPTYTNILAGAPGTLELGLQLYASATTSLVGYTDADWAAGHVRVLHVPSRFQYADIFTKGLPSALFEDFRSSLSVRPPPAPTAGAY